MHKFLDIPAQLRHRPGSNIWQLIVGFTFRSYVLRESVFIPAGFITDLASIPKAIRWFIDNDDKHILEAAIVHDYLYQNSRYYSRKDADKVLIEGMEDLGAPAYKRFFVYLAVRAFGWMAN